MTDRVTVKVNAGQSLVTPDGRLIHAGETVEVSAYEAAFFERMGAAEIVVADPAEADPKPAKKPKTGQQS